MSDILEIVADETIELNINETILPTGIADVVGLQAELDRLEMGDTSAAIATHSTDLNAHPQYATDSDLAIAQAAIATLISQIAGKSDVGHGHAIAAITGLQTALDGKATAAQGAKADSAVQPADITTLVSTSDPRLSDLRIPVDGSASDTKIGDRTASDATAPTNLGPGSLTQWLGWVANRLKAITGKANWWTTPAITLEATAAHVANLNNPHSVTVAQIGAIAATQIGAANGIATLDVNQKLTSSQLPEAVLGALHYGGIWNAASNTPAIAPASAANKGLYYVVSSAIATNHGYPNVPSVDFASGDWLVSNGASWDKLDATDQVSSVNGKTGVVVLTAIDLGLGTIASQNANNVSITGGAIDGVAIGATTPNTGKFSSLSATNLTATKLPLISTGGQLVNSVWSMDAFGSITFPSTTNTTMTGNNPGFLLEFINTGSSFSRQGLSIVAGNSTGATQFLRFSSIDRSRIVDLSMSANREMALNQTLTILGQSVNAYALSTAPSASTVVIGNINGGNSFLTPTGLGFATGVTGQISAIGMNGSTLCFGIGDGSTAASMTLWGQVTPDRTLTTFGQHVVSNSTASTAPTNGAIVTPGGVGVGGDAQIGGAAVANSQVLRAGAYKQTELASGLVADRKRTIGVGVPSIPATHDECQELEASTGRPITNWFWDGARWLSLEPALAVSANATAITAASTQRDLMVGAYPYSVGVWLARLVFYVYASGDQSVNGGYTISVQKYVNSTGVWTTIGSSVSTVTMTAAGGLMTVQNLNVLQLYSDAFQYRVNIARNGGVSSPAISVIATLGLRHVRA